MSEGKRFVGLFGFKRGRVWRQIVVVFLFVFLNLNTV